MQAKYIRKITPLGTSLAVVIPPSLLAEIRAQRGDSIAISVTQDSSLLLTPLNRFVGSLPIEERDYGIIKL